jgi:hypothetical protein
MRAVHVILLSFFLPLLTAYNAFAAVEVKDIRIEARSAPGADARELAVSKATRQAAEKVWADLYPGEVLPELTPEQLQGIATYVDVTNETIQTNYYTGTFNIGLSKGALLRATGKRVQAEAGSVDENIQAAPAAKREDTNKEWLLVVPVQRTSLGYTLWNADSVWQQAWLRAPAGSRFMATAGGDSKDRAIFNAETLSEGYDFSGSLLKLADKYGAPAVAMVTLQSAGELPRAGEELEVLVDYYPREGGLISRSSSIYIDSGSEKIAADLAVKEAQKLAADIIAEAAESIELADKALPPFSSYAPTANPDSAALVSQRPVGSATSYVSPSVGSGGIRLWVRMPLKTPMDATGYRRKIAAIAGARFEMTAMTREYIEGNIIYFGNQARLMEELANAGLRARN